MTSAAKSTFLNGASKWDRLRVLVKVPLNGQQPAQLSSAAWSPLYLSPFILWH